MNALFIITPRRTPYGVWIFNDDSTGLVNEPFVGETNLLLDCMALERGAQKKDFDNGVALIFGSVPFPDYQCDLTLIDTALSGTTYHDEKTEFDPWLCPAFFRYFPEAPEKLYGMIQLME